jgi:hypothetical protein
MMQQILDKPNRAFGSSAGGKSTAVESKASKLFNSRNGAILAMVSLLVLGYHGTLQPSETSAPAQAIFKAPASTSLQAEPVSNKMKGVTGKESASFEGIKQDVKEQHSLPRNLGMGMGMGMGKKSKKAKKGMYNITGVSISLSLNC